MTEAKGVKRYKDSYNNIAFRLKNPAKLLSSLKVKPFDISEICVQRDQNCIKNGVKVNFFWAS